MEIKTLGYKTDFIFCKALSKVKDHGEYVVISSEDNPTYFAGNYILFKRAPQKGDLFLWEELFKKNFIGDKFHHYAFGWDVPEEGDLEEFKEKNYHIEKDTVLAAKKVNKPENFNKEISVKAIVSDAEWQEVINLQSKVVPHAHKEPDWKAFKDKEIRGYRKMMQSGLGCWFGAYIGNKLVGDVGIYFEETLARFHLLETHPEHRGEGVGATLLHTVGHLAFTEFGSNQLSIITEEASPKETMLKSLGFKIEEHKYFVWGHHKK